MDQSPLFFTRTRGLFRECFLGERSEDGGKTSAPLKGLVELYMSPVETWCLNLDYYIPDQNDVTKLFNQEQMTRVRKYNIEIKKSAFPLFQLFADMMRAMIALFIVGFFFMFVSFTAGILGCWKTSPSNITASAILMLIACKLE